MTQGSDPSALPPSGMRTSLHQPLSMQPGGRYGDLSWDDMMRSLSDPVFQTRQDGTPIIPPVSLSPSADHVFEFCRGCFIDPLLVLCACLCRIKVQGSIKVVSQHKFLSQPCPAKQRACQKM